METITLRAHFDGKRIVLDEPCELEPNTKLIITVLPKSFSGLPDSWAPLSLGSLESSYGDTEPEYSLDLIKEANPEYESG